MSAVAAILPSKACTGGSTIWRLSFRAGWTHYASSLLVLPLPSCVACGRPPSTPRSRLLSLYSRERGQRRPCTKVAVESLAVSADARCDLETDECRASKAGVRVRVVSLVCPLFPRSCGLWGPGCWGVSPCPSLHQPPMRHRHAARPPSVQTPRSIRGLYGGYLRGIWLIVPEEQLSWYLTCRGRPCPGTSSKSTMISYFLVLVIVGLFL